MIKPEQVPKECLVAYQRAFKACGGPSDGIAAAINAWPGMVHYRGGWEPVIHNNRQPHIILPLPQEKPDNEV